MASPRPAIRTACAILLAMSDIALAASFPILFFAPSIAILMFLAFPGGLALARWQFGSEPWAARQRAANTTLWSLLGLFLSFVLLVLAGRTRPEAFEVGPALMLLAVVWAGLSTYAIGLLSLRMTWKPATT